MIYGSNWPVSEVFAPLPTVHRIVHDYFGTRGEVASCRYFAGNAQVAYKWLTGSGIALPLAGGRD